jgi:hypothetical protein
VFLSIPLYLDILDVVAHEGVASLLSRNPVVLVGVFTFAESFDVLRACFAIDHVT